MRMAGSPARPAAAGIRVNSTQGRRFHRSHGPGLRLKRAPHSKALPSFALGTVRGLFPTVGIAENQYQKQLENRLQKILKNDRKGWVSLK